MRHVHPRGGLRVQRELGQGGLQRRRVLWHVPPGIPLASQEVMKTFATLAREGRAQKALSKGMSYVHP